MTRQTTDDAHGSPDRQLAAVQAQLKEKDALVAALTERLEQAAEKLDRVHRSGGDRGLRMGAIPPELIDQQVKLTEELQQAVEHWEAMQPGAVLGRIEVQITELRDLVANGLPAGGAGGGSFPAGTAASDRPAAASAGRRGEADSTSRSGNQFTGWEALKAGLMKSDGGGGAPAPQTPAPAGPPAAERPSGETEQPSGETEQPAEVEIEEVPPPAAIDVPSAGIEALRAAVERRDEYITYLARKLRLANGRSIRLPNWEALNNAPEDLKARIEELERQLDGNLRLAEVELSLERARLAREAARLRLQQEQVEKELKRLKLDRPQAVAAQAGEADNPTGRRWLRMLGMGKAAEDDES